MKSMKWLALGLAVCLCGPAAQGAALLTQGSNEIGISGQLDTSGVAGTDFDLKVKYAYFFWDRTSLGLRGGFGDNDWWSYFSLGRRRNTISRCRKAIGRRSGRTWCPFFSVRRSITGT